MSLNDTPEGAIALCLAPSNLWLCPTVVWQQVLAVASEDGAIRCYNVRNGERICELQGHEDAVQAVLFDVRADAPDASQFLVSCGSDCSFKLWG